MELTELGGGIHAYIRDYWRAVIELLFATALNKKVRRWIRYTILTVVVLVCGLLISLFVLIGVRILPESIWSALFMFGCALILPIGPYLAYRTHRTSQKCFQ